ncbi:MAG: hormogonium polysaccharide biosynthesis glycosyltransferase HpsO [Cyanobacteriota bacterium]|nr:hormogonium polysaccharide biosynthesis glycosyltransferase HpsO [Cyanobacteriota bacterium]
MKILVASHTYIVDLNCEKLRALAQLEPEIEVTIVVPKLWRPGGVQNKTIETRSRTEGTFRVIPLSNFSKNNQGLLTFGTDIVKVLRSFRPDIIQAEQGAKSLAYAELISLNRLLNLKAKNVFFTWWNLPYESRFPVSVLENYNLRHTDGVIAGNQDGVDILRDRGYHNSAIVLPQLGVDETLFARAPQPELAAKLGIEGSEFVVGFVGRFVEEKGLLTLLQALAGLKERRWKWLLLGRGPLRERLEAKATELGLRDRIIWIESVPHHEVPRYINLMSALVLPSETTYKFKTLTAAGWKEQFGHVLIEAMACSVPVIGSDSGEIPNVIDKAGLIFPEKDVAALRQCLQQLMEQPQLCETLGNSGYERAMQRYTNKALAREQLAFYQQL